MPTPEELERMSPEARAAWSPEIEAAETRAEKIETLEAAARAAAEGLGQPVYSRPAPMAFTPEGEEVLKEALGSPDSFINTAWAPKVGQDLPLSFEEVLGAFIEEAGARGELEKLRREIIGLYDAKAKVYQDGRGVDSCFKRGLFGLFHNLGRKWDRIETVGVRLGISGGETVRDLAIRAEALADGEKPGDEETLYKTVRDLVVYGLHTLRWLQAEEVIRALEGTHPGYAAERKSNG